MQGLFSASRDRDHQGQGKAHKVAAHAGAVHEIAPENTREVAGAGAVPWPQGRVGARTLILIRWGAIAGQAATLLIVHYGFRFALPVAAAFAVVAASVVLNLALTWRGSRRSDLSDRQATASLGFDILQLAALLALTGGLQNPFSLLLLAPVTIAATTLSRRNTVIVWLLTLFCIGGLLVWHLPLPWDGPPPSLPGLYVAAAWAALTLTASLIAFYGWTIAEERRRMANAFAASQAALDRARNMSALGALAAAAAHELGTPLSTIAVVAKELAHDLPAKGPLAEDAALLQAEVARCRDILAQLGRRAASGRDDMPDPLPLRAFVAAVAAPYEEPAISLVIERAASATGNEPLILQRPEPVHGLANLLHNALRFARGEVRVTCYWDAREVSLTIDDDGPGFDPAILGRLGEPYVTRRHGSDEHLGLGIFIACTLLERSGAWLRFENRPGPGNPLGRVPVPSRGARVRLCWPRSMVE